MIRFLISLVPSAQASEPVSVSAGAGLYTHYSFRGANYFSTELPDNPAMLLAPWAEVGRGSWTLGWWSGQQVGGDDRKGLAEAGFGSEQDLYVGWSTDIGDSASFSATGTAYWYARSTKEASGADGALWLEPSVALEWGDALSWGVGAAWYQGVQTNLRPWSYGYFSGSVGHSVPIREVASIELAAQVGLKAPRAEDLWPSNTADATLSAGVAFDAGPVSVQPAANVTFTNGEACSQRFAWFGLDLSAS